MLYFSHVNAIAHILSRTLYELFASLTTPPPSLGELPEVLHFPASPILSHILARMNAVKYYRPPSYAIFPYVQTVLLELLHRYLNVCRVTIDPSKRDYIVTDDNQILTLEWITDKRLMADNTPSIVLVFVLGLSNEHLPCYMHPWVRFLNDSRQNSECVHGVILTRRGTLYSLNTRLIKRLPIHADTEDLKLAFEHLHKTLPWDTKLVGVGYSAGGNHLVKYAATYPTDHRLTAIVNLSTANNLQDAHHHIVQRPAFDTLLARDPTTRIERILPNLISTFSQLNHFIARLQGYDDIEAFYEALSSHREMLQVNIPLLNVASEDDPILPASTLQLYRKAAESHDNVITVLTQRGGHVAWLSPILERPWIVPVVYEFATACAGLS